jgi:transposase
LYIKVLYAKNFFMFTSLAEANAYIEQQQLQNAELTKQLESAKRSLSLLQHQVEQLLRKVYGRKSEKMDPKQLVFQSLMLETIKNRENETQPVVPSQPESSSLKKASKPSTPRQHPGRIPIPEHLERNEIILDIPEKDKIDPETGKPLKQIGVETSEKLEYRPGKLIVNVYKRPKYAAPDSTASSGVIVAPMPDHPIPKCKADVGLIGHIIVSKFADHLPCYRLDGIFDRDGVTIPRATQIGWLLQTYDSIRLLGDVLKQAVLEGDVIFTDDSIIPLWIKGRGKLKKGRLWVYVRGDPLKPLIAFDFSPDRCKKRPLDFLKKYKGYVHADAYGGYDELFRLPWIIEVACWAHARRKFDEALSSRSKEATEILLQIAQIYQVEKACKEMKPDERRDYRKEHATPILDGIFKRLEELKLQSLPSEPLRKAIDYALNQRKALYRYLEDGRLKPDNNTAENAIRLLALGRKNWLFSASEKGAQATALFLGLIQSCKANRINPWEYVDDMLRRIMSHPVNRLRELLPDQWKPLAKDDRGLIVGSF